MNIVPLGHSLIIELPQSQDLLVINREIMCEFLFFSFANL